MNTCGDNRLTWGYNTTKQSIKPDDYYPEDVTERRFNRLLELMVTGQRICPEKSDGAVVAMLKLLRILPQMFPGNVNMSPANGQFQPCPESFNAVDMGSAFDELFCAVIDGFMLKSGPVQSLVVRP